MIVATTERVPTLERTPHRRDWETHHMGIKKISKRLAKVGRKASERLGDGGKKWVEAVFETPSASSRTSSERRSRRR
jgi:hypothetical protein